nr:MAG: nonstructural polyprotein [Cripavirus sp.]
MSSNNSQWFSQPKRIYELPRSIKQIKTSAYNACDYPRAVALPTKPFKEFVQQFVNSPIVPPFNIRFKDENLHSIYYDGFPVFTQIFMRKYMFGFGLDIPHLKVLRATLRNRFFIRYDKVRTIIPLRYVYSVFAATLHEFLSTRRHVINRQAFEHLRESGLNQFPLIILIAFLDLENVDLMSYKFTSTINVKTLHTQLPLLFKALDNSQKLMEQYDFLYVVQNFIHFYHRTLHFTNPLAIMEEGFIADLTKFCTSLVLIRPIATSEAQCNIGEYGTWEPLPEFEKPVRSPQVEKAEIHLRDFFSTAQICIDSNIHIDPAFINSLDKIAENFGEAVSGLHGVANRTVDGLRKKFACYLSLSYNLYRVGSGAMSFQDGFMNIITSLMQSDIPTQLLPQIKEYFVTSSAQSASVDGELILKLLATCAFVLMVRKIPGKKDVDTFIGRLDRVPKAISGIESIWKRFDSVTGQLWSWIEVTVLKQNKKIPRTEILDSVSKWVDELSRLLTLASRKEIQTDLETLHAAGRMYSDGIRLMKQCKEMNLSKGNLELIARNLPAAKLLLDEANMSGADKSKLRTEPVIVWFSGASGNGKTGVTYPFVLDMMRVYGEPPATWQQNVYAREPETEFWDGYINQEYIIYDDFIQLKDSQLKPNPELFEMIRLGNMFPYQCHMASLLDKNNTFAEPKLLCLTSNLQRLQIESLNCPEAVARRIDFSFNVRIVPEYQMEYYSSNGDKKYRLDAAKARKDFGSVLCFDVYRFDLFCASSGKTLKTDLTYTEMVEMCQTRMKDRSRQFYDTSSFLESYRTAGVAQVTLTDREKTNDSTDWNGETMYISSTAQVGIDLTKFHDTSTNYCKRVYHSIMEKYYRYTSGLDAENYAEKLFHDWTVGDRLPALKRCQRVVDITRLHIEEERRSMVDTLRDVLGPYWKTFKTVALVSVGVFTAYLGYKVTSRISSVPAFIKEDESLLALTKRANKCLDNGCVDCTRCVHKTTDICIKWYTKCSCYAMQMEKTKEFLKHYAVAALYQEPEQRDDRETCVELLSIVEQLCNCDCMDCKTCCDVELMARFKDVAKVYNIPCVCICARLSQGFSLPEILALVKHCGSMYPSPITNPYLKRLYAKLSNDVTEFEGTPEGKLLVSTLHSEAVTPARTIPCAEQSHDDETNMRLRNRHVVSTRYQATSNDHCLDHVEYAKDTKLTPVDETTNIISLTEQRAIPENDKSLDSIINFVVYPNTVYMTAIKSDGKETNIGHIIFVCGQVALMPYHYRVALEERNFTHVKLYSRVCITREIPTSIFDSFVRIPEKDAMLVAFPVTVNSFKNITSHFVDIHNYPKIPSCPAILAKYHFEDGATERSRVYINSIGVSERDEVDVMSVPGCVEIVRNRDFYSYVAPTRAGDCGAALVVSNTGITGKIVGIHVSGIEGLCKGNSSAITKQMLEVALKKVPSIAQYSYPSSDLEIDCDALEESGAFVLHKYLPSEHIATTMSSAIRRSVVHGRLIATPNKPGHLRPFTRNGQTIDPAVLQRRKYGIPRPYIDPLLVEDIKEAMKSVYYACHEYEPVYYKYPLTTQEAILGIEGDPYINSLDRTTAPGYPYSKMRKSAPGKQTWFGSGMDYDITSPAASQLLRDVENLEMSVRDGIRPEVVWTDTLKDQKISIAKAELGKTRLFSAAPMHYAIALRKVCAPFIAHLAKKRIDNTVCVGVNPFSCEWGAVYRHLVKRGKKVIAGDYSNFDGTLPAQLVYAATELFAEWYDCNWEFVVAHNRHIVGGVALSKTDFLSFVKRLYYECVHHLHIMNHGEGALMYYVRNGIPSGCPVTAPLNSVVNHFSLAYCWMQIFKGTRVSSLRSFFDHTSSVFYGDDFIMNIRDDVIESFNQETITKAMKEHLDMVMTDEAKTNECVRYRSMDEVSFLKRKFRFERNIHEIVAPLDLTVILDSTNWYKLGLAPALVTTKETLESCTRELSLHPIEVDNEWRTKITSLGIEVTDLIQGASFRASTRQSTLIEICFPPEESD